MIHLVRIKLNILFGYFLRPTIPLVADFDATPIRVTILPGDTDVTVSIPIVTNTTLAGEERFNVTLEASGIGVIVGDPNQAEVTNAGEKAISYIDK